VPVGLHAVCVEGHVVARDLVEAERSKAIVRVCRDISKCQQSLRSVLTEVGCSRLGGVVTGVVSDSLLESNLVDDPLALVLDVKESHSSISSEAKSESATPSSCKYSITHVTKKEKSIHSTYFCSSSTLNLC
jgi:hypothetical protein